jgi:hypothetical protein
LHGGLRCVAVRHLHEAEAAGLAGVTISNNTDLVHSTIRLEELAEIIIRHTVRKITNINVHASIL